jgi:hypothetical protein
VAQTTRRFFSLGTQRKECPSRRETKDDDWFRSKKKQQGIRVVGGHDTTVPTLPGYVWLIEQEAQNGFGLSGQGGNNSVPFWVLPDKTGCGSVQDAFPRWNVGTIN